MKRCFRGKMNLYIINFYSLFFFSALFSPKAWSSWSNRWTVIKTKRNESEWVRPLHKCFSFIRLWWSHFTKLKYFEIFTHFNYKAGGKLVIMFFFVCFFFFFSKYNFFYSPTICLNFKKFLYNCNRITVYIFILKFRKYNKLILVYQIFVNRNFEISLTI